MNKLFKKIAVMLVCVITAVLLTIPSFATVLIIETPDGNRTSVDIEPSDFIETGKEKISDVMGISPDAFYLTFRGKTMQDGMYFADYGIRFESLLNLYYYHRAGEKHEATEGTCSTPGTIEWYSCTTEGCDAKLDADGNVLASVEGTVSPDRHTWNNGEITKEATEEEDGIMLYTCLECGNEREEHFSAPIKPDKIKPCTDRISSLCDLHNKVLEIPGLNIIIGFAHRVLHTIYMLKA